MQVITPAWFSLPFSSMHRSLNAFSTTEECSIHCHHGKHTAVTVATCIHTCICTGKHAGREGGRRRWMDECTEGGKTVLGCM